MKKILRIFSGVFILLLLCAAFVACDNEKPSEQTGEIDYASVVKLDQTSNTLKQEVTVKSFIDGDTTHFNVSNNLVEGGVLKARYLAINTPESTGKIEEYGKTASDFTKSKLQSAYSIMIESDNDKLNADSTGSRYLVWVWYKPTADSSYRNLNIEILQNGLAIASNSAQNRYGDYCVKAIQQAKDLKLNVYSGQKDPRYYYGTAQELTLKELRLNIEKYDGTKVAFEGVVTKDYSQTVYVEEYDEELDLYFGMTVYYGFGADSNVLKALKVGNRVRIVGSVQYYANGGTYQVSGLSYRAMKPNDPENVQLIEEGHEGAFKETSADTFVNGKVTIAGEEDDQDSKTYDYAELVMSSSISMKNLVVKSIYTTTNEESSSKGAMTITCEVNGVTVDVRTIVLYEGEGQERRLVTADKYEGKIINVKGIVDYYNESYQIKVYSVNDIEIVE